MKEKTRYSEIFEYFDRRAEAFLGRTLHEDEKAVAHMAIYQGFCEAVRERMPFASALEKILPRISAHSDHLLVLSLVRKERGNLEKLSIKNRDELLRRTGAFPANPWLGPQWVSMWGLMAAAGK